MDEQLQETSVQKKSGSLAPIVIVVGLLIIGGIYFATVRLKQSPAPVPYIPSDSPEKISG
ncbi:hypothetical protein EBR66_01685 [bacterium]|nr:hypothetical protein [bacterium]